MNRKFTNEALEEFLFFKKNNPKLAIRILRLLDDIEQHPYQGIGKPEPLRHEFSGYWSRRIDQEHRLVYKVDNENIYINACRYHYIK